MMDSATLRTSPIRLRQDKLYLFHIEPGFAYLSFSRALTGYVLISDQDGHLTERRAALRNIFSVIEGTVTERSLFRKQLHILYLS